MWKWQVKLWLILGVIYRHKILANLQFQPDNPDRDEFANDEIINLNTSDDPKQPHNSNLEELTPDKIKLQVFSE